MCTRLLKALAIASEKAANVARLVRQDEHLFELLVQEKTGDSANARFVRDFKTLADVLIQEMVRHDISTLVSITHICKRNRYRFSRRIQWVFNFSSLTGIISIIPVQFPELKENIRGEEENTFTNALGDSITVSIQADVSATADLLEKVRRRSRLFH